MAGRAFAVSGKGFYRSVDGGAHWSAIPTTLVPQHIAFDPNVRDRIYADVVYRSDDGGATFSRFGSFPFQAFVGPNVTVDAEIGRVAVSPRASTDLYVTDSPLAPTAA